MLKYLYCYKQLTIRYINKSHF